MSLRYDQLAAAIDEPVTITSTKNALGVEPEYRWTQQIEQSMSVLLVDSTADKEYQTNKYSKDT
jgi:hypothetical protein